MRRTCLSLILMALFGLATSAVDAAPAKSPPKAASIVGSCTIGGGVSCADYEGLPAKTPREMCLKYKGTWSNTACPTAKRVGTCTQPQGAGRILTHSYQPSTPDIARKACSHTPGGKFSAN